MKTCEKCGKPLDELDGERLCSSCLKIEKDATKIKVPANPTYLIVIINIVFAVSLVLAVVFGSNPKIALWFMIPSAISFFFDLYLLFKHYNSGMSESIHISDGAFKYIKILLLIGCSVVIIGTIIGLLLVFNVF